MIAAFSAADQLRRRPAPVNNSMRRTGSGICLCSEIDMCRSPHPLRQSPFRRQAERCTTDIAYAYIDGSARAKRWLVARSMILHRVTALGLDLSDGDLRALADRLIEDAN